MKVRGSLVKRGKNSYAIVLDYPGVMVRTKRGTIRQKQTWVTFKPASGTPAKLARAQAKAKMRELLHAHDVGTYVEPTKLTFGEWLTTWLVTKKLKLRENTVRQYEDVVNRNLIPALGSIPLQDLGAGHIEQYHLERRDRLSGATLQLHHVIISNALKSAVTKGKLTRNVATNVEGRPSARKPDNDAQENCWTLEETQTFLAASKNASPQLAALCHLAIDTGMRRNEMLGLRWEDVDLEKGTVRVDHQLLKSKEAPRFGPTKNGQPRTVDINDETVRLLREHRRTQAELKMANRTTYHDHNLVFVRDWPDLRHREMLGLPLNPDDVGFRLFQNIVKAAEVRRITFHGLRHTSATLLLGAGEPVHVVAGRLGHKNANVTLAVYAHALPSQQRSAAANLGALLASGK